MGFDYAAKIQALLARADHPNTPAPEAASCRATAERLMRDYRIAEEDAIAREIVGHEPIQAVIRLTTGYTRMGWAYTNVWHSIEKHCGVRAVVRWDNGNVAHVVGYEGDVRYAEFLWTAALMMFATRIDPTWDNAVSFEENVWRLRGSGVLRKDVAYMAGLDGSNPAHRSRVQSVYVRECARRGETPLATGLGFNADAYRTAYAESFHRELGRRLRDARDAADNVGGGLVLHGRADRVREAFYVAHPDQRPKPADPNAEPAAPCPACAKAKSGHCRQHPAYSITAADRRRWNAVDNSTGNAAGRRAAEGVVIQRGGTRANRLDASGRAIES